jgi:hypothetical protein
MNRVIVGETNKIKVDIKDIFITSCHSGVGSALTINGLILVMD